MEKQFVTYEIALKLKELGFDEPCFAMFNNLGEIKHVLDWNHCSSQKKCEYIFGNGFIQAPLWQQVIDWFREKYDLHIVITVNPYSEINEVNGFKIYDGNKELNCISNQETQTWSNYEAREQAILKALELCQKEK